jgi:hypothetical protein
VISTRTLRRCGETTQKRMLVALADKAWSLAETLGDGERWICRPSLGLDAR